MNEAREKTEHIIDYFHKHLVETTGQARNQPRTYPRKVRKDYLEVAKQKSPAKNKLRKAIGKQLRYLKGNLGHIKAMIENNEALLTILTDYEYKCLLVIDALYQQQLRMYSERIQRIEDRIVSISQPHVRVKAGRKVEFGAQGIG